MDNVLPSLQVEWVLENDHSQAVALLRAQSRRVSLVDGVSFVLMRRMGIATAFAFDPHYLEQGFAPIP